MRRPLALLLTLTLVAGCSDTAGSDASAPTTTTVAPTTTTTVPEQDEYAVGRRTL